ncbi:hypothetical protein THRCLA_09084 [Thraustotheca clavata]|uniref:Uncharacterized protein n=1 Tax=Thraustotheca clavata TaxID=74557 RepID=A0A1V9YZM2_9STRA|nr:hypothetical protein THRCLA_09084 [Thraustotheca clavata]
MCIGGAIFTVAYGYIVYSSQSKKPSVLVSALATTCLRPWYGRYDIISSAMCGLLTFGNRIFYLKLWSFADSVNTKPKTEDNQWSIWTRCLWYKYNLITTLLAVLYIIALLFGGLLYLGMTSFTISNDMLWASFNMSDTHAFVATWFYGQIYLGRDEGIPFTLTNSSINTYYPQKLLELFHMLEIYCNILN